MIKDLVIKENIMRFPNLELVEECQSVGGNYCGEAQAEKRRKKKKKKKFDKRK